MKKAVKKLIYFVKGGQSRYVNKTLCGVPLRVNKGVIREKEDQDDTWWFYLAAYHDKIFDVGCNVGYTALLALIQNPDRQIIMIDPNPKAIKKAAMNLIENNLGNRVQYFSAFVSNSTGDNVKFYAVDSGAASSMYASHAKTASSNNLHFRVETVTLDYLYQYYKIKPDLVKIDVEGAETLVIDGSSKLALETKCTFFIEMHALEELDIEKATQFMLDWCEKVGYNAWYLKTGEILTFAQTIKNRGKYHLLLIPKEKNYPEYLKELRPYTPLPKSF